MILFSYKNYKYKKIIKFLTLFFFDKKAQKAKKVKKVRKNSQKMQKSQKISEKMQKSQKISNSKKLYIYLYLFYKSIHYTIKFMVYIII